MTAKGGFLNESHICEKFLNWKTDEMSSIWLRIMGYDTEKIQKVNAVQIPVRINLEKALSLGVTQEKYDETIKFKKADVQIKIEIEIDDIIYVENLSLKKSNKSAGFNQIDKRSVETYKMMWRFDENVEKWLKGFTGETLPEMLISADELKYIKDSRRLFLTEIPSKIFDKIISFFSHNKSLIISDVIRGRGSLSAEWFLVTRKDDENENTIDWILKDINTVCNFFGQGDVRLSPRGSLAIGRITMQRKGGTPDPTSLQFKMNPLHLFELEDESD